MLVVTNHSFEASWWRARERASLGLSKPGSESAKREAVEFPKDELRLPLAMLARLRDPALEPRLPGVVARGLFSLSSKIGLR